VATGVKWVDSARTRVSRGRWPAGLLFFQVVEWASCGPCAENCAVWNDSQTFFLSVDNQLRGLRSNLFRRIPGDSNTNEGSSASWFPQRYRWDVLLRDWLDNPIFWKSVLHRVPFFEVGPCHGAKCEILGNGISRLHRLLRNWGRQDEPDNLDWPHQILRHLHHLHARDFPLVVWKHGDHEVVDRPVAQRSLRYYRRILLLPPLNRGRQGAVWASFSQTKQCWVTVLAPLLQREKKSLYRRRQANYTPHLSPLRVEWSRWGTHRRHNLRQRCVLRQADGSQSRHAKLLDWLPSVLP